MGSTNNLKRRLYEHKTRKSNHFTAKYKINRLIYFHEVNTKIEAVNLEIKIKGWTRKKKIELVKSFNPDFEELIVTETSSEILRKSSGGPCGSHLNFNVYTGGEF